MSDLIRALAIATAISRLSAHPNLRTYATRRFQYVTRTTILRRHSQRVLTFRQISRQEQRERRRVVDGDLVVRQFRGGTLESVSVTPTDSWSPTTFNIAPRTKKL